MRPSFELNHWTNVSENRYRGKIFLKSNSEVVCLKKWLAVVPSVQEKNISSATCKFWEWVMKDNCLNWHKIWSGKCCRRARNAKIPQSSCKQIYWIISFTAFCICTQLLLHTSVLLHTCFCYLRTGSSVELTEDNRGKNDALLLSRWLRKISPWTQ